MENEDAKEIKVISSCHDGTRVSGSTVPLINLSIKWRLSGQLHALTTFQSRKMLLELIEYEPK
jgi:hypothetical protein